MTIQQLASEIARLEGKKSQVKIGDVREVLRVMIDLEIEHMMLDGDYPSPVIDTLYSHVAKKFKQLSARKKPSK